jgi:hypothetical protein
LVNSKRSSSRTNLNPEERVKAVVEAFAITSFDRLKAIDADELLEENGINPFLIWALGINDFHSLAKFSVYQRIGRSFVTSFGQRVVEEMVISASGGQKGEKGGWWDVIKYGEDEDLYMSVKSGPADMDADQVRFLVPKAKELMKNNPKAVPIVSISYGRKAWSTIPMYLKQGGLDPDKHAFFGKALFDRISHDPKFHVKLPGLIRAGASTGVAGRKIIELIDAKVLEVETEFKRRFKSVDKLLDYVSEPPPATKLATGNHPRSLDVHFSDGTS